MSDNMTRREMIRASAAAGAIALAGPAALEALCPRAADAASPLRMKEAMFYKPLGGRRIQCLVCPKKCEVGDRERGFCGSKENRDGKYYTLVYGSAAALGIDPPNATGVVDDLEAYAVNEGEGTAGVVLGWNFGDGHLHHEQLLAAVQAECGFAPGDLRVLALESQPAGKPWMHWRVFDAADGLQAEGEAEVLVHYALAEDIRALKRVKDALGEGRPLPVALREQLSNFRAGRLVVHITELPIKCPVAPLEFCFLLDWFLREQGVRENVDITYATPLDAAFTKPVAAGQLGDMFEEKGIELETEFATGQVDGESGRVVSWDEREIPFDLLVAIPLHGGSKFVSRSPGLGDDLGFIPTDQHTLQSEAAPNVFAIGDATNLPTSKAGSATHFEGETLTANIGRFLAGEKLEGSYDGHVNCFIETGFHKALLIDFNYEVEPGPGRFPEPHVGPLPLMAESRLNHMGKLMFEWVYWHVLLPGRDMPGVSAQLQTTGHEPDPE